MTIDLFGHGVRHLPSGVYSDGPDRKRGPAKCRGVTETCSSGAPTPHDHSCCCDPCRHMHTDLCAGATTHCCKCIPRSICATFTPDSGSITCYERSWNAVADRASDTSGRSTYTYSMGSGSTILSVGGSETESGVCTWKLYNSTLSIDEEIEIDHSGPIHCQAPPEFAISGVNVPHYPPSGSPEDCYGTITFQEASLAKVPFEYKWTNQEELDTVSCGDCTEVCNVLCVRRGNGEETTSRTDFVRYSGQWLADDTSGEYFSLLESGGHCYISLDNMATPFNEDLILIDPAECSIGMSLSIADTGTGDWLRASCNPCSCWDYVCGSCRCVCKNLCVAGVESGVLVPSSPISWDYDNIRWGDDDFNASITRGEDGNCISFVSGYESGVSITNTCGNQISFYVEENIDTQLETGIVNYLYLTCKNCDSGECGDGTCLSLCEDVPSVIYAEVCPDDWDEMLGCDTGSLCFECVTFPLLQRYVPTFENPAGEYRWQGYGIISCKGCNPPTAPVNFVVSIDIGCDGLGTFTVTGIISESFSITIPCEGSDVWDFEFIFDGPGSSLGCCGVGGFILRITE